MTKRKNAPEGATHKDAVSVTGEQLAAAVVNAAKAGFMGMLSVTGQSSLKVVTDEGTWPLPAGDYIVLMLPRPTGESGVRWLRASDAEALAGVGWTVGGTVGGTAAGNAGAVGGDEGGGT